MRTGLAVLYLDEEDSLISLASIGLWATTFAVLIALRRSAEWNGHAARPPRPAA